MLFTQCACCTCSPRARRTDRALPRTRVRSLLLPPLNNRPFALPQRRSRRMLPAHRAPTHGTCLRSRLSSLATPRLTAGAVASPCQEPTALARDAPDTMPHRTCPRRSSGPSWPCFALTPAVLPLLAWCVCRVRPLRTRYTDWAPLPACAPTRARACRRRRSTVGRPRPQSVNHRGRCSRVVRCAPAHTSPCQEPAALARRAFNTTQRWTGPAAHLASSARVACER